MKMIKTSLILALIFLMAGTALAAEYAPLAADEAQIRTVNLFLSNFSETGVQEIGSDSDDAVLVDFAHDHLWFNSYESFEYGEFSGDNNCRVADDEIQQIIDAYLYEAGEVDLFRSRFDYDGEYYYHCETGGWCSSGFVRALNVYALGENRYFAPIMVFGDGMTWENDVLDDAWEKIEQVYGEATACGSAIFYCEDLSDRSSYRLISYSLL